MKTILAVLFILTALTAILGFYLSGFIMQLFSINAAHYNTKLRKLLNIEATAVVVAFVIYMLS